MTLIVYSTSPSFEQFLSAQLDGTELEFSAQMSPPNDNPEQLYLLHITGMQLECTEWLLKHVSGKPLRVGVCADVPDIREMLECVRLGAKAYCNSYMAPVHYTQMLRLLADGQSWFPPQMLDETFRLALKAATPVADQKSLQLLTSRERDIALAVAEGKSNRQIAEQFDISEPTVKSHLTHIFKKLELKDRVGLVLHLKQA